MQEYIHGICLRVVKHSDNTSIATLWTRERGRVSATVPAGSSPAARRIRALMMPLSPVEAVADFRPGREIVHLKDLRPGGGGNPATDPLKGVVCLFLSDFLYTVLGQSPADERMTDYIAAALDSLRGARGTALANFHIVFMCGLGHFLGIAPDAGSYTAGAVFDMRDGIFRRTAPTHRDFLPAPASRVAHTLLGLDLRTMGRLRLSQAARNEVLDRVIDYYSLHHTPLNHLASLSIVRSLFT